MAEGGSAQKRPRVALGVHSSTILKVREHESIMFIVEGIGGENAFVIRAGTNRS